MSNIPCASATVIGDVMYLNSSACFSVTSRPFTSESCKACLGKKSSRVCCANARHFGDLGVIVDGLGIGIGPVDRAAQGFDKAYEGIAPLLERIGVGDVHANGLLRERRHIAAARDDDEPAVRQLLQHEGRHR